MFILKYLILEVHVLAVNSFYLLPHPPIIIPDVGGEEVKKIQATYDSMKQIGREIGEKSPDTIILISPHGNMFRDAISLLYEESVAGNLGDFGAPQVEFNKNINLQLTDKIVDLAEKHNIPVVQSNKKMLESYNATFKLDHGAMVPFYFIDQYYKDYNILHITYGPLKDGDLYKFGKLIQQATKDLNVSIIASGDLSHRLKDSGPYDYHPDGPKFDTRILSLLESGNKDSILNMNKNLIANAGECGMRSILILIGAMDSYKFKGQLLSYEGTFGVGYGVMKFHIDENPKEETSNKSNPYVRLARDNLSHFLNTGNILEDIPSYVTHNMRTEKKGVFVTLYKDGNLRGCIGTIFPTTNSLYEEILRNSIEAGLYDPRFMDVKKDELKEISFSVDILDRPEPAIISDLDPKQYGIILSSRGKRALLLPNLQGVDTVEEQVEITKQKAGIRKDEDFTIERFKVTRFEED